MSRPLAAVVKEYKAAKHDTAVAAKVFDVVRNRVRIASEEIAQILAAERGIKVGSVLRNSGNYHKGDWEVLWIGLDDWRDKEAKEPTFQMVRFQCQRRKKDGTPGQQRVHFSGWDFGKSHMGGLSSMKVIDEGGEEHGSEEGRQNAAR